MDQNTNKTSDYNIPRYTLKDMWWACTKVAIGTFVVASIYFQFKEVQKVQKLEHETTHNRIEYINERIDKKHDQQDEYIKEQINLIKSDNVNQWEVINKKQNPPKIIE